MMSKALKKKITVTLWYKWVEPMCFTECLTTPGEGQEEVHGSELVSPFLWPISTSHPNASLLAEQPGRERPVNVFLGFNSKTKVKSLNISHDRSKYIAGIDNQQHQRKGFRLLKEYYHADMVNFLALSKRCGMLWSDSFSPWAVFP